MLLQLFSKEGITSTTIFISRISVLLCIVFILLLPIACVASWIITPGPPKGLRQVGLLKTSNLSDQYDDKYTREEGEESPNKERLSVKALYIYPIKSCKPIEVSRVLLTKTGFAYDRCFAFAAEEKNDDKSENPPVWRMISQRTKPQMSLIDVELWVPPDRDSEHVDPLSSVGGCLVVTFPDPGEPTLTKRTKTILSTWNPSKRPQIRFTIPLMPTHDQITKHNIQQKPFALHSRTAQGLDLSNLPEMTSILPTLKLFLKIPAKQGLTLFRCTSSTLHNTTLNLAPLSNIGTRAVHGYTDQQPLHILNLSSVHAVSDLLPAENQPLNALRFRANLYFTGASAYDEERWKRFRILSSFSSSPVREKKNPKFSVVCRTSRCTMPNVVPERGVFEYETPETNKKRGKPQPSTTLVEHRTVEDGNGAALGYLGMHCVPEDSSLDLSDLEGSGETREKEGRGVYVEVGDGIEILERGIHLYGSTGDDY